MNEPEAIEALAALSHKTRLAVFKLLVSVGPEGVPSGDIARKLAVPATTMSTHLAVLTRAGLIAPHRDSRTVYYRLDIEGTQRLFSYLMADCCAGRADLCGPALATLHATPLTGANCA
jgi:ArsR family transcriptional regulator, arsenate/arsenite/antimonite-responsive transcriptional repressor